MKKKERVWLDGHKTIIFDKGVDVDLVENDLPN